MALSKNEIDLLIAKLRNRYDEYAKKFNPKWFDNSAFRDRLEMALKNRMNLEAFILAEISNFEKVREKYEKKKEEKPFSDKIDRIMEENLARIRKYPEKDIHPEAGIELMHFYGALSDFTLYYYPMLWVLLTDNQTKDEARRIEEELNVFSLPRGGNPPKRIEDHILVLNRKGVREIEIEKNRNAYLKEAAFVLNDIVRFSDRLLERREPEWEVPLRLHKLFIEESRRKRVAEIFSGATGYGAILKIRECAAEIIDDFRLTAFKRS